MNLALLLRNWKTTAAGGAMLVALLGNAITLLLDGDATTNPDWNLLVPELLAAIALLMARDSDVSSKGSGVK